MTYEIFVESMNGTERLGQLSFESLALTMRFNSPGKYEIKLPVSAMQFDFFKNACRLVILRDNSILFSGPLDKVTRKWEGMKDDLILTGVDDMQFLANRIAVPVPGGPPYTSADCDVRTGPIETLLYDYVKFNAGSGAIAARQIAGLTLGIDQGRGVTAQARARFTPLLPFLRKIAILDNFGFRVRGMKFEVYQPQDKTELVIFAQEMNNLISFKHEVNYPKANYVYVGGGGEGTSRVIVEGGNADSITQFGRIEMFKDQRNTSDTNELQQVITQELLGKGSKIAIEFSANANLDEFGLGDLISVAFDGVVYQDVVQEINIKTDGVTENVIVTSGSVGVSSRPDIYNQVNNLQDSISLLEAR